MGVGNRGTGRARTEGKKGRGTTTETLFKKRMKTVEIGVI